MLNWSAGEKGGLSTPCIARQTIGSRKQLPGTRIYRGGFLINMVMISVGRE